MRILDWMGEHPIVSAIAMAIVFTGLNLWAQVVIR